MAGWTHSVVSADEIQRSIQESLDSLSLRPSDPGWQWSMATEAILRGLGELGRSKGLHVRSKYHNGEWLWDLCWVEVDDDGWIKRLVLACESELAGRLAVQEDFQKIIFSAAEVRLLVCVDFGDSYFDELQQRTRAQRGKYLAIGLLWNSERIWIERSMSWET